MSFDFGFDKQISDGIVACNYVTPTPIQQQAIPEILAGHDLLGLAQTGTGKTAAFALPLLQRLLTGPRRVPRALIVAPTRELAEQIHENFQKLGRRTGLKSVSIYGGVSKSGQVRTLRAGVEIIVACPGRLLDHLQAGDINLSKVEVLVCDEADMMFDMGFLPVIRRILKLLPRNRQNLFFSATMPEAVRRLADEILTKPVTVMVNHSRPANTVSHHLFSVEAKGKGELLKRLMQEKKMDTTLIFTRTKYAAANLAVKLQKAGYQATSLQGNMSQSKRQQSLNGFKEGRYNVLVATDIAARGIDVTGISHVINYDVPDTVEAYTHRIGRTGRAEKTGMAYTFAGREDGRFIRDIEKILGTPMARESMGNDFPISTGDLEIDPRPARRPQERRPRQTAGRASDQDRSGRRNAPRPSRETGRPQENRNYGQQRTRQSQPGREEGRDSGTDKPNTSGNYKPRNNNHRQRRTFPLGVANMLAGGNDRSKES